MMIRDYTLIELEQLRQSCNFTEQEMRYFNLKAKDLTNIQVSLKMNISTSQVSRLAKRVKDKISKVTSNN